MIDEQGQVCCDTCGQVLCVGEYPYCPHGFGGSTIRQDEIPGGLTVENYGPHPITFYSHGERRRYMKEHGLTEREKFAPLPGTDIDPQGIPNPKGYMDDYTREAGAALIARNGQGAKEPEFDPSTVLNSFSSGHLTRQDAIAIATGDKQRQSRLGRRIK